MCGRYSLHANPEVIALQFGLDAVPSFKPRYNITPGTDILVVGPGGAAGKRWGLVPAWAKDPSIGNKLANARGETVAEKPSFRQAFRRGRCLVPASGYYEWQAVAGGKQPWYFSEKSGALLALAGIAERWAGPEGPLDTVCLITTVPNALAARIHDRMPVIVAAADHAAWLDPACDRAGELLRPFPEAQMQAWPVSRRVNSPRHDDPALIEPEGELDSGA
jgi:putative SOS response-associated peptidase YedK